MAKGYGLTGKVRGKLGSNVYRIVAGKQVISEYNPTKSGDPTKEQITTRGKMALANSVSKLFPFQAIAGLSPNRATARNTFNGLLMRAVVATWYGDEREEFALAPSDIVMSNGTAVAVNRVTLVNPEPATTTIQSRVFFADDGDVARYLFITMLEDKTSHEFSRALYTLSEEVARGEACKATIVYDQSGHITTHYIHCWIVPIVPNTIAKRIIYDNLQLSGTANAFTIDVAVTLSRANIFARSYYIGRWNE